MQTLASWLRQLSSTDETDLVHVVHRLFVPGHEFLDIDDWVLTTEQPMPVMPGFRGGYPETMGLLSFAASKTYSENLVDRHRLSSSIASTLSLVLDRRIEIPNELSLGVKGQNSVTFLPAGQFVENGLLGPLPTDAKVLVDKAFQKITGLQDKELVVISQAADMYYGSVSLYDRDLRSAYTLLVAGIEILSRRYGNPPKDWDAWDKSGDWDKFMAEAALSVEQSELLRSRLLSDRQLRLKANFRSYASSRLRPEFWDQSWVEWNYPARIEIDFSWGKAEKSHTGRVGDFLPRQRDQLSKSIGFSYDLRSSFVHEGKWFGPLELSLNSRSLIEADRPLPYTALRLIFRELILAELDAHSEGGSMPKKTLSRNWSPRS